MVKKPPFFEAEGDFQRVGRVFGTPLVVRGITWFPLAQLVCWGGLAWWAGQRDPRRTIAERIRIGGIVMPFVLGSEWLHNLAHAAAAALIDRPMDAIRVLWGMPLCVYHDLNDARVSPRQHIVRALGGPLINVLLLPLGWLLGKVGREGGILREVSHALTWTNKLLLGVGLLPLPGIDGGPLLKWSLVERGHSVEQADRVIRQVDGVLSGVLGLGSGLSFRRDKRAQGALLALLAALSLGIATGLIEE